MAKTWVPKNDTKAAKAFAKAMRAIAKGGRRQHYNQRPR